MFVSGWKWKAKKIIIAFPDPSYESLVSINERTGKKERKNPN